MSYTLIYWGGNPGRGEYIRLAFEYTHTPYDEITDPAQITAFLSPRGQHLAPPILAIDLAGPAPMTLSQTPAILAFLAPRLGLAGADDHERTAVNQLTLTALDLSNEAHDVHHPISPALYYADQQPEAARRADSFRTARLPKFLAHFEAVLAANPAAAAGVLVGARVSTADLTLAHVLDGVAHAFPRRIGALRSGGAYARVFALADRVRAELAAYLGSPRRCAWGNGVFRHYPELDGE